MGEQASTEIVQWAIPFVLIGVFTILITIIGYIASRKIDKLDNLSTRVDKLETSSVTAEQVRAMLQEHNQTVMMAILDVKDTMTELNSSINKIQQEFAFKKGLEEGRLSAQRHERDKEW